jgi:hypothetical protein
MCRQASGGATPSIIARCAGASARATKWKTRTKSSERKDSEVKKSEKEMKEKKVRTERESG